MGRNHGERRARAYNGGLGLYQAPGEGFRGASPPEADVEDLSK